MFYRENLLPFVFFIVLAEKFGICINVDDDSSQTNWSCSGYSYPIFDEKLLKLIDGNESSQRFLFRSSSLTKEDGTFDFGNVEEAAKTQIKALYPNVPDLSYNIFVFNLQEPFLGIISFDHSEFCEVRAEYLAMKKNAKLTVSFDPVRYTQWNPYTELAPERLQIAKSFNSFYHDNTDITTQIHKMLADKKTDPLLIFFHCHYGHDRTGIIAGSYLLKYKNWSMKQVMDFNTSYKMSSRVYIFVLEWYCLYLEATAAAKPDCSGYRSEVVTKQLEL